MAAKAPRRAFLVACWATILLALSVLSLYQQVWWLRDRVEKLEAAHPTVELPEQEGQ